jgi:hypothetical protein
LEIGFGGRADFVSAADTDQTLAKSGEEKLSQKDPNSQRENRSSPEWQAMNSSTNHHLCIPPSPKAGFINSSYQ